MFIGIKPDYFYELVEMSEIDVKGLFEEFKRSIEPFQGLKMLDWIEARKEVYAKYRVNFSPEKLEELTREEFMSFLDFKVNRSWTGLHRHKTQVTEDMNKLRKTIAFVQNEKVDIKTRINQVLDRRGKYWIRGMGKNLATAILQICDEKDRYGIWNNRTEDALEKLELTPEPTGDEGEYYFRINGVLNDVKSKLNTDLVTIDGFLWWIDEKLKEITALEVKPTEEERYSVSLENDLINYLASHPQIVEKDLRLHKKEYATDVGRMDLLCIDGRNNYVVIEAKKGKESDKVVGQILRYMGWIKRKLAQKGQRVRGIIVVSEYDERLDYSVAANDNIQLKYYKVKFELRNSP